jgi:hypothetical protein
MLTVSNLDFVKATYNQNLQIGDKMCKTSYPHNHSSPGEERFYQENGSNNALNNLYIEKQKAKWFDNLV